jgi:SecD/SecF fusion protein
VARSRTSTSALVRGVAALLVLAFSFYVALTQTASLGLDLSGGTQIVIQTQDTGKVEANAENTDKALEVLRQRVNQLGVNESTLARSGENRIIVELPGVQNPDEAAELIGSTAQLSFHEVLGFGELPLSGQGPLVPTETPEVSAPDDGGAAGGGAEGEGPEGGAGEGEGAEGEGPGGGAGEGDGAPPGGAGGEEQKRRVAPSLVSADGDQPTDDQPPADEQTTDPPADEQPAPEAPAAEEPALVLPDESGAGLQLAPASLTGEDVTGADAELTQQGVAEWVVNVTFNGEGGGRWQQITSKAACARVEDESDGRDDSPTDRVAIVLDDQIISSPTVQSGCPEGIPGGSTQITGNFNQESATDLAVLIEGGALPLDVEIIEQRTVGPTLGQDAIDASIRAALIGLALTGLFICFVYRLMGFLATLALASYTLMAYALLVAVGATLTLPGLAGFVLAIGMAIDANVLVFERAREEYARRRGEGLEPALETGYRKALSAILDSNITTLLAAALLFFLAAGPVRGFGVTLSIGVLASMVSALVVARFFTGWAIRRAIVNEHPSITGLGGNGRLRTWLQTSGPDIMRRAPLWVGMSAVIILVAIAGVLIRGLNLGVEFTGGRIQEFNTSRGVNVDDARTAVVDAGFPTAVVQTSEQEGDESITVRTGDISNAEANSIEEALVGLGVEVEQVRDELIGPSLGEELRNKAVIALAVALAVQMLYMAFRFRWTFGLAAMIAMVNDVMAVVGVFAWTQRSVDGIFLAAALTIIGLSVNDTVVVFDRVRERLRSRDQEEFGSMVNEAALATVPRTINTGLGAMFILGALVFLGGSSLTDFSLALLIGLIVGTLSSVFAAAPLVVLFEKRWPDPEAFAPALEEDDEPEVARPRPRPVRGSPTAAGADAPDTGFGGTVTVARPKPKRPPRDKYAKADPYADIGDGRDIPSEDGGPSR